MKQRSLVLTLMAPRLSADNLIAVEALVAKHGLDIEQREWLAAPESSQDEAPPRGECIEYRLQGGAIGSDVDPDIGSDSDIEALREQALTLGATQGVDIAIQEDSRWRRQRRLVCFDMDSTLIQAEVIDELARRHDVFEDVAAITERAMRGELDFKQSFRQRMAKLKGLDEAVLAEIAADLPLMPGIERLMHHLKRLGYRTVILSGGFSYFARYLQDKLGFDEVHANELVIENGQVIGEVREPILDAVRKAELLQAIAKREGLQLEQTVAVGDGANDLKMLAVAGLGIAYRAKPLVRREARQSISTLGLDAVLYLLGHRQDEIESGIED